MLDEGVRLIAYKDQFCHLTIGVGRNLDSNPFTPSEIAYIGHDGRSQPITHDQAIFLLHDDESNVFDVLTDNLSWWGELDDVRARVLVDLCFNMGWARLSGFHHFIAAMCLGNYQGAAAELENSQWFGQVGVRGPRLVNMVRTGEDYIA